MNDNFAAYLNDHLAGSVAAIELIDDLISASKEGSLKAFLSDLKREIQADQKVLEEVIERADENESVTRKAAAWVTEKLARTKFKIGGEDFGGLGLLQALEMLALGIRGKELLWRALEQSTTPLPGNMDLADLKRRALEQQQRLEQRRLEAARAAFV
jgi:uncharacterized protein DUF892